MIKKLLIFFLGVTVMVPLLVQAQVTTQGGGTGSTSPSGVLIGVTGNLHLQTLKYGAGLSLTGTTLNTTFGTTSINATAPLNWNTTNGTLTISQSGVGTNGYLSSTDWNTFNNKQPAGTYVTSLTVASSNGFAGSFTAGATPALTITTSINAAVLKGNGTAISAAVNGTDYTLITAKTCNAGDFVSSVVATGVFTCTTPAGTTYTATAPITVTGTVIGTSFSTSTFNAFTAENTFTNLFATNASSTYATSTNLALTGAAANCNGVNALTTNSSGVVGCTAQPQGTVTSVSGTAGQINSTGGATPILSLANHVIFPAGGYESAIGSTTNATSTNFAITGAPATNCNGTNALTTNSSGVVGCTAQPQGTVTNVTGGYPIQSTGGATPNITTAFGTTTTNIFSNLNTFNGGILVVGSSTIVGNATTTGTFFAGIASSTSLFGANLSQCNSANQALNWNAGLFTCATISASGGAGNWFTPTTYNLLGVNATSTSLWLTGTNFASLIASSTYVTTSTTTGISMVMGTSTVGTSTSATIGGASNPAVFTVDASGRNTAEIENLVGSSTGIGNFLESNIENYNPNGQACYSATQNGGTLTNNFNSLCKNNSLFNTQAAFNIGYAGDGALLNLGGNAFFGNGTVGAYTYINNGGTASSSFAITISPTNNNVGIGTTTPYAKLAVQAAAFNTNVTLFAIGSSTASATTTLFAVSNIGTTTLGLFGACNTTKALTTDASGNITCGSITGGGGAAYPFTPGFSNFGTTTVATSTPFSFLSGIFASSTSQIASTTFAINGNVGVSSSTPGAVLSVDKTVPSLGTVIATTTFSTPGAYTFTSPTSNTNAITKIQVFMWGAGGGGGRTGGSGAGGGGGAGAYVIQTISSNFKTTYTGIIGTGGSGSGGAGYAAGATGGGGGGGSTSFTDGGSNLFIACGGGSGGDGNGSGQGGNGASGTSGGAGGNSPAGNGGGGGGCGTAGSANAGTTGGAGGTGGTTATSTAGTGAAGVSGSSIGGGGGGAAGGSGQSNGGAVAGSNGSTSTGGNGGGPGAGTGGTAGANNGGAGSQLGGGGGGGGGNGGGTSGGGGGLPGAGGGGSWNGGTPLSAGNGEVIVVITYAPIAPYNLFDVAANGSTGGMSLFNVNANGTVAIGGPTPSVSAALFVAQSFSQAIIFAIQGTISATKYLFEQVDQWGHLITGGPAPTCGTGCSSVVGDDRTFRAVTGTGVTAVTVNFSHTYTTTPVCISADESGGTTVSDASSTPSAVTMNLSASLTTKTLSVICQISTNFTY